MKKKLRFITVVLLTFTIGHGQTWTEMPSPTNDAINCCSFVNENKGWIVTNDAIFITTNGGLTWSSQSYPGTPANMTRQFKSVHFINENVGIIACQNIVSEGYDPSQVSSILWTNNGGIDWVYKNMGAADFRDNDAKLVSPLVAYTIGQAGNFKKTTDGGSTWINYNFSSASVSSGLKLAAINESTVYFGGNQSGFIHFGTFGKTADSGNNWLVSNASGSAITAIHFTDTNHGWIGGYTGLLKHTTDAGDTWTVVDTGVEGRITDIAFTDDPNGWATTNMGHIINTTNEGAAWNLNYLCDIPLNSIDMITAANVGYTVGDNGLILKYNANLNIAENTQVTGFNLYPNPAQNIVNIKLENLALNSTLVIYNQLAQAVKKIDHIQDNNLVINLQDLSNGLYYIQLYQENKTFSATKLLINNN